MGLASPPHFVYDFSRKIFLMLYSINPPNLIVRLPLLLEILSNVCIVIICYPVCDVINFENNHNFLIKPGQNAKFSKIKQAFNIKQKAFFIIFKGFLLK